MLAYLLVLFFFLVSYLAGRVVVKLSRIQIVAPVLVVSLVLGLVTVCLLLFASGFLIPLSQVSVVSILSILTFVTYFFLKDDASLLFKEFASLYPKQWSGREKLSALFFIILAVWLFGRALFIGPNGQIIAGDRLVWVDWPLHIGMAANFAWGGNIPPQNPTFAGIPLIYPFFSDFLSGMLLLLGASYPVAFNLPGIILTLCFFSLFVSFGASILGESFYSSSEPAVAGESRSTQWSSRLANARSNNKSLLLAFGALFLSLFWGGLGFVYWLKEAFSNETQLVETLLTPAREYTFWSEKGLWFFTFLYSEILPQRAFLFGLPLFFLILLLVKNGWEKRHKPNFLLAGILTGILPLFHTHTFLSVVFLLGTMVGIMGIRVILGRSILRPTPESVPGSDSGRARASLARMTNEYKQKFLEAIFLFGVPFTILAFFQLPFFLQQSQGLPWEFGWLKGKENFFLFWFKNTGFFIPLFILGLWKGKFSRFIKIVGIASWILFILPNLFRFAAWGYDNLKIFTFWYLLGSFFVMGAFGMLIKRFGWKGKVFAGLLFLSLTLSGMVEVGRLIDTSSKQIGMWSKEDQEFALLLRTKTKGSDVFLAASIHDHPVVALAGRRILLGFPGNSWSWGIKGWDEREKDMHTMFRGGEVAKTLWKKYGINYIVVGDRERYFEKNLDETFISQNSKLILEKGKTKVYKVN